MRVRSLADFSHYGQRSIGDVWEELDHYAKQLIDKGLAEEFTLEMEESEKAKPEAESASKPKAKVKTNDKPADADGSQATPES